MYDVIIIGAGPSGLMTAANLNTKNILLIDKNEQVGGKLKVAGGGRCNVTTTNTIDQMMKVIMPNPKFLYPALNNFSPKDFYDYLTQGGVELKEEDHGRIFPTSNKSQTIVDFLYSKLKGIELLLDYDVRTITKSDDHFIIDETYKAKKLVIATGGQTYHNLGTTGDGYEFCQNFGHTITELFPTETPLVSNDDLIQNKTLQGVTLKDVQVDVLVNNKAKLKLKHDLLFTHFGFSGPLALHSSTFIYKALKNNKKVHLRINQASTDIPKRLRALNLEELVVEIHDTKGWNTAFLTGGGVSLKEINPATYESKLCDDLYIVGELLDINCYTGGNNISVFAAQGMLVAQTINNML